MMSIRSFAASMFVSMLGLGAPLWACGDIGVISPDARFVVLDGNTLQVKDVGNLWWLGIRTVLAPVDGSTLDHAVIATGPAVDPATGMVREEYWQHGGYFPLTGYFALRNLVRDYTVPPSVPSMIGSDSLIRLRIVRDEERSSLVGFSREGEDWVISVLDDSFNVLGRWPSPSINLSGVAGCIDPAGRIVIGALAHRLVIDPRHGTVEVPGDVDEAGGYLVSSVSLGCKALAGKASPADDSFRDVAIIDLAQNVLISQYSRPVSTIRSVMSADGTRILQQVMIAIPVPGTVGVRREPTGTFRVIDTANGNVIRERTLDIVPGEIHQQLLCRGAAERVVIQSPNAVHLLDVNTLEILATQQVPFERYFILGD